MKQLDSAVRRKALIAFAALMLTADAKGNPLINVLVINDPNNSGQDLRDPALNVTLYHCGVTAVPEPTTLALMLAGLLTVGGVARCRCRA